MVQDTYNARLRLRLALARVNSLAADRRPGSSSRLHTIDRQTNVWNLIV